jgi:hypothetical protein
VDGEPDRAEVSSVEGSGIPHTYHILKSIISAAVEDIGVEWKWKIFFHS